jgi:predicted nuclease of restriction endonuclease-like (RecB) superfamily
MDIRFIASSRRRRVCAVRLSLRLLRRDTCSQSADTASASLLYWQIGRRILELQQAEGWGAKVVERLSRDLRREFPAMKGFSRSNLLYMRAFAEAWPDEAFVQQAAGQIPWFHNCLILDRLKSAEHRVWYLQQTITNGWSRNVLALGAARSSPQG